MTEARKAEEKTLRPLRKNSYELAMESTTKLAIDEPQDIHNNGQADLLPDGGAEAEEEKNKDKTEKQKLIPLYTLFRFATWLDILMILLGAVMSIASGVALPAHIFLFGQVINQFVYYEQAVVFQPIVRNQSLMIGLNCEPFRDKIINGTIELAGIQNSVATAADMANNSDLFFCQQTSMFSDILNRVCDPQDVLIDEINMFTFIYIGLATGVLIVQLLSIMLWNISAYRQTQKMREAFYHSILRQEIGWFDVTETAQLSTHLADDIENIQAGIGDKAVLFLQSISTFLAGYAIAFSFSWKLALVVTSLLPFVAVLTCVYVKLLASFTITELNAYAAAGAVAEEVLGSIRTVVAFGGEQKEVKRYGDQLDTAKKEGIKKGFITSIVVGALFLIIFCIFALGFWYGSTLIIDCELSAGDVVTVFFTVLYGGLFLGKALPEIQTFATARTSATTVFKVIDRNPTIDSSSDEGEILDHLEGNIEFNDLTFHYPARRDAKILDGLNLKISKDQTVALAGPSGCGKSTIIQLLLRFYDPDAGLITIDGKDIKNLNLKWLRRNIGVVSQEPVLFNTTIAENIRFGREDATMEDIERAAKNANAYKFISRFPDGFNTHVGERGAQLSGGQKQRIAIARALVRDPKILLLDEATSALDTESERIVQEALDKARRGRTTIVIAHRLSTIQTADIIASIDHGRVVEMGDHHELMDNEGLYFELVTAQTDTIASFKAAVKRSYSRQQSTFSRQQSTFSRQQSHEDRPPFSRQPTIQDPEETDGDDVMTSFGAKTVNGVTEEIQKVSWKELYKLNLPDWRLVLVGVIGSAILGAFYPLLSILFSEILRIFGETSIAVIERDVRRIVGGFVGLAFAIALTYFTASFTLAVAGERLTKRMRYKTFKAMLRQDIAWFDDCANSTGALTTRLSMDASEVKGATGINLGFYLQMIFAFITAVIIAFIASWELTLVVVVLFPVFATVFFLQRKFVTGRSVENKKRQESRGQIVVESIANIRTVAVLGVEDHFLKTYVNLQKELFKANIKSVFFIALVYALAQSMTFYIYCTGYRFGAFLVIEEQATYDQVFRVFAAMVSTAFQLGQTSSSAPDVGKARVSAAGIVTLLNRKEQQPGFQPESLTGEISVENVHFHYPTRPEVKVLQGLTVSVKPGQTLALVGPSGCGKSTIISLIERFYDPVNGSINVDGNHLTILNLKWIRSQIGIVLQEPVLFDTTIADNIRYGANFREVSDEEVIEAAKSANIHNFIESLPQGYNTNTGSKGKQMSGGQKQRIAIARALVRNPKILLLDEATSALDTESETTVQEALDKAREGRTSIVITHRLSTIHNADCIAVIHNGEVIESGTHTELMAQHGAYRHLNTIWQKNKT